MNITLNRIYFDKICNKLITAESPEEKELNSLRSISLRNNDWNWVEHSTYPNFGYLERNGLIRNLRTTQGSTSKEDTASSNSLSDDLYHDDSVIESEDPSSLVRLLQQSSEQLITLNLSICLSATFHVPVLYFTAHFTTGTPLTLTQLLNSTIFHPSPSPSSHPTSTSTSNECYPHCTLSDSDVRLPYLSQGEHPTTGISSWFLHPCETEGIVKEVLLASATEELKSKLGTRQGVEGEEEVEEVEEEKWEKWMRTWLMIVGTLIDLKDCESP